MSQQVNEAQREREALVISSERQLFVDDYLIQEKLNVTRKLHQVTKYEDNPILHPDRPWEGTRVSASTVMRDGEEGIWKMWYSGVSVEIARVGWVSWEYSSFGCYATSQDGIHWKKPKLGIFNYKGSTDNNIVGWNHYALGAKEPLGGGGHVLKDISDPDPKKRYKRMSGQGNKNQADKNLKEWPEGLYLSFSPDGIHWRELPDPIFRWFEIADASGQIMYDPKRKKYVMFGKRDVWEGKVLEAGSTQKKFKRARMISESDDFIHWTKFKLMLAPDEEDPPDDHFYDNSGFYYESMYLGFLEIYHTQTTDTFDIQFISSRDAQNWERAANRKVILPAGLPDSDWDYGCLYIPNNPPIRVGDELWIYYTGMPQRHDLEERPDLGSIGLAKLRLDGFVSLDAKAEEGIVLTKPLKFSGEGLFLNADANKGIIKVELLDRDGKIIPGYERKACNGMFIDKTKHLISWKDKVNLSSLQDKEIMLKFYMKDSSLYSFWFDFIP